MNTVHISHSKVWQNLKTLDCFEKVIYWDKMLEMMDKWGKNIFILVWMALVVGALNGRGRYPYFVCQAQLVTSSEQNMLLVLLGIYKGLWSLWNLLRNSQGFVELCARKEHGQRLIYIFLIFSDIYISYFSFNCTSLQSIP